MEIRVYGGKTAADFAEFLHQHVIYLAFKTALDSICVHDYFGHRSKNFMDEILWTFEQ